MDLYAYSQIEDLKLILEKQNINVPRLRGLRLMKNEEIVPQEKINEGINDSILYIVRQIVEQNSLTCWSSWKEGTKKKVLIYDKEKNVIGYHWNKIHGKKRKWIKWEIKKTKKAYQQQYDMFNSFVGKDVLYVHSRIGGNNWNYFKGFELLKHPDYLKHVDDCFDSTYCDIYFKIRGGHIE